MEAHLLFWCSIIVCSELRHSIPFMKRSILKIKGKITAVSAECSPRERSGWSERQPLGGLPPISMRQALRVPVSSSSMTRPYMGVCVCVCAGCRDWKLSLASWSYHFLAGVCVCVCVCVSLPSWCVCVCVCMCSWSYHFLAGVCVCVCVFLVLSLPSWCVCVCVCVCVPGPIIS